MGSTTEVAMNYNLYFALSCVCLVAVIALHCGNSPSRAMTTSPAIPVAASPSPLEPEALATLPGADRVAAEPSDRSGADLAAASAATIAEESSRDSDGLLVRRLIVARGVENREPVGAASRFDASAERIYAFMEMVNDGDEDREVVVTFERDDGTSVGNITVNIPANAPRWRTWAWSHRISTPGTWTAVISTADGTELGRERFEVEG